MVKSTHLKKGFRKDSFVNQPLVEELEALFNMVPPSALKKSITDIFFAYLCNTEVEDYKPEMKEIATDFYFMLRFLEVAEMYERQASLLNQ